jgi:hypothetical protein
MSDEITLRAIVPAEPGWFVVRFIGDDASRTDDPRCLWYYPIVAWDIERSEHFHTVLPVTADGERVDNWGIRAAFKRPDGTFESFEGGRYKTEADLIESFKETIRERAEELAAMKIKTLGDAKGG